MSMTKELMNKLEDLQDEVRDALTNDGVETLKDFADELAELTTTWLILNIAASVSADVENLQMAEDATDAIGELETNPAFQGCISIAIGLGYLAGRRKDIDKLITLASEAHQLQLEVLEAGDDPDLDPSQLSD